MKFSSIRLVTNEFKRLIAFYQKLSGIEPLHLEDGSAEVRFEGAVLAITSEKLIQRFNAGAATAAANRSVILEFQVDDVDAVWSRMRGAGVEIVMAPKIMAWGHCSLLLRDPDANLVNVFSKPTP